MIVKLTLYSSKVCFPGSALSKLWVNLPIRGFTYGEGGRRNILRPRSQAADCNVGFVVDDIPACASDIVACWAKLCAILLPGMCEWPELHFKVRCAWLDVFISCTLSVISVTRNSLILGPGLQIAWSAPWVLENIVTDGPVPPCWIDCKSYDTAQSIATKLIPPPPGPVALWWIWFLKLPAIVALFPNIPRSPRSCFELNRL